MAKFIVFALIALIPVIYFAKTNRTAYLAATMMSAGFSLLMMYSFYITKPPQFEMLVEAQGIVEEENTRNSQTEDVIFKLKSSPISFSYIDWYPDFENVSDYLKSKPHLIVLYDPNSDLNDSVTPWSIISNKNELVSFKELKSAGTRNRWLALTLSFVSAICTFYLYRKTPAA
jgi:hypothetical protein